MKLIMPEKTQKILILGDGLFAEIAYEYFTQDSHYEVAGFAVDKAYRRKNSLFELPVIDIDDILDRFPPETHHAYVAIVYTELNRVRSRLMQHVESRGYALASYVSSRAFVWPNAKIGKHCFIFENNVIQPFVTLGDNAVLWSGNHIGHHSILQNNLFISSHVVVSGSCKIGSNCFIGVNSTIANNVSIGEDCFLNLATTVTKDLEANKMYRGTPASAYREDTRTFFNVS